MASEFVKLQLLVWWSGYTPQVNAELCWWLRGLVNNTVAASRHGWLWVLITSLVWSRYFTTLHVTAVWQSVYTWSALAAALHPLLMHSFFFDSIVITVLWMLIYVFYYVFHRKEVTFCLSNCASTRWLKKIEFISVKDFAWVGTDWLDVGASLDYNLSLVIFIWFFIFYCSSYRLPEPLGFHYSFVYASVGFMCHCFCDVYTLHTWIFTKLFLWDGDELFTFLCKKIHAHSYSMTKYAKKTICGVCFCDVSRVLWWIFSRLLSLSSSGKDEQVTFWSQNVKGQDPSRRKHTELDTVW